VSGLTSLQTVWLASTSAGTSALPTRPLDPVTRIFIAISLDPLPQKGETNLFENATEAAAPGQAIEKFKAIFLFKNVEAVEAILTLWSVGAKRAGYSPAHFCRLQFLCEPLSTDRARESPVFRANQGNCRPCGRLGGAARRRADRSAFLSLWRESSRA